MAASEQQYQARYPELMAAAKKASGNAYAPYSHFHVGAALLCADGSIVSGCNVENASYGLTLCAERNAIVSAVVEGKREFLAMAVYAEFADGQPDMRVKPCGACRQVMSEFLKPETPVLCPAGEDLAYRAFAMSELLPHTFDLRNA